MSELGINLGFAVKRWPEPEAWCQVVREQLGLRQVQFTFDLLDPNWPGDLRLAQAAAIREAAKQWDIEIHSAFVGIAAYTYNGLLHPDPAIRATSLDWWHHAIETAGEMGASAVGGPLGGMSVTEYADPTRREARILDVIEAIVTLTDAAHDADLAQILIEPTPLRRELPHTPEEALWLLQALEGRTGVPVRYVIDIGHALYQPLYGESARLENWFTPLRDNIGVLHIQNTDFQSDSHWGWPDNRGLFDVAAFAHQVRDAGLEDVPTFLEVFYPFELSDEEVLANITSSVDHCRQALESESGTLQEG
jgi:sugar phosphate isomerase/epimerase